MWISGLRWLGMVLKCAAVDHVAAEAARKRDRVVIRVRGT